MGVCVAYDRMITSPHRHPLRMMYSSYNYDHSRDHSAMIMIIIAIRAIGIKLMYHRKPLSALFCLIFAYLLTFFDFCVQ